MPTYYPNDEMLLVLRQSGYSEATIKAALDSHVAQVAVCPELSDCSDKDFLLSIKCRSPKETAHIAKKFNNIGFWVPGYAEIENLKKEGYWEEIIYSALIEFLSIPEKHKIVISKFSIFRAFLISKEPLECLGIDIWEPSA